MQMYFIENKKGELCSIKDKSLSRLNLSSRILVIFGHTRNSKGIAAKLAKQQV